MVFLDGLPGLHNRNSTGVLGLLPWASALAYDLGLPRLRVFGFRFTVAAQ